MEEGGGKTLRGPRGTDPNNRDTDGDGIGDGVELHTYAPGDTVWQQRFHFLRQRDGMATLEVTPERTWMLYRH